MAEKKWQGQAPHAAVLGEGFAGARVVVASVSGRCSQEFRALLQQDLVAHGVTVASGGSAEPATPGPTDVISVDIAKCQALPREPILGSGIPAVHISRTEAHFLASLRVVDLASGGELTTLTLRADPGKQNESQTSSPEYPSPPELVDMATRQAIEQTRRLYAPWKENQELVFMDDKDCNLRESWDLLKNADYRGLLRTAKANAESCHASPKTAASAWYDLGLADMLVQNYTGALSAFDKAQNLHDIRQTADLIDQCRRNKALAEAIARQVVSWTKEAQANQKLAKEAQTGIVFDNDLVVRLVQGNVSEDEIIKMVGTQPNRFALAADDIAKVRDAGVPESIVNAMLARK